MVAPISKAKRAAIGAIVDAHIREACRSGAPTPTYYALSSACRALGVVAHESKMSIILDDLESAGRVKRIGGRYRMVYRTDEGETAARSASGNAYLPERMPRGPSLEERAAMWGCAVALTHPSDRPLVLGGLPARPFVSAAGRWESPLA